MVREDRGHDSSPNAAAVDGAHRENNVTPSVQTDLAPQIRKVVAEPVRTRQTGSITVSSTFSGPLPPPDALKNYEEILPGTAKRIVKMVERQAKHRQEIESRVVRSGVALEKRGQWIAFSVVMAAIIGGFVLVIAGQRPHGLAVIITAIAAVAGVFFYARKQGAGEELTDAKPGVISGNLAELQDIPRSMPSKRPESGLAILRRRHAA